MKQILRITFLLLLPLYGLSQTGTTISYEDFVGPLTLTYNGLVNGKHSYTETGSGSNVTVQWTGTRWEISCCSGGMILYKSDVQTAMNPPDLNIGNWEANNNGTPMQVFSGTGTTSVLPVELLSFEAKEINKSIMLNWETASEINNEKFEIEESQDGGVFQKIGEVKGNGTTFEQQQYSFEVKNIRNGIFYYRLKQMDFDGQFEYSKVISVDFKNENGDVGEFYPNPSKSGLVNLDYFAQNEDEITVSVFDMTGKLVINQIQSIARGNNNLSFNLSGLNTGIYTVKIGNERNITHRKLIIER